MKVRIISNGDGPSTQVLVDGEPLTNVISVQWTVRVDAYARATLELDDVEVDVVGELSVHPTKPLAHRTEAAG